MSTNERTCTLDGCDKPLDSHGWCGMHASRWRRTGDPLGLRVEPGPTASESYVTVHRRLIRERGKAREHACVDCGERAREWSYDHADPDEWWEVRVDPFLVLPYSLDLSHYAPRCTSCHRLLDARRVLTRVID